jgi:hypothetical protein
MTRCVQCGESGLIDVVVAVARLTSFSVWCRGGSGSVGWSAKLQRGPRVEGDLHHVVVTPGAIRLLKAHLWSPDWLCRGVATWLA